MEDSLKPASPEKIALLIRLCEEAMIEEEISQILKEPDMKHIAQLEAIGSGGNLQLHTTVDLYNDKQFKKLEDPDSPYLIVHETTSLTSKIATLPGVTRCYMLNKHAVGIDLGRMWNPSGNWYKHALHVGGILTQLYSQVEFKKNISGSWPNSYKILS